MTSNMSRTYFKNADDCAEIARTTRLGNIRDQQLGAERAWRVLGDRAFATERKARERSCGDMNRSASGGGQD